MTRARCGHRSKAVVDRAGGKSDAVEGARGFPALVGGTRPLRRDRAMTSAMTFSYAWPRCGWPFT